MLKSLKIASTIQRHTLYIHVIKSHTTNCARSFSRRKSYLEATFMQHKQTQNTLQQCCIPLSLLSTTAERLIYINVKTAEQEKAPSRAESKTACNGAKVTLQNIVASLEELSNQDTTTWFTNGASSLDELE